MTGRRAARVTALLACLVVSLPFAARCYEAGDLTIEHPWARATIGGQRVGAAYVTLRNRGREPERLVAVRAGVARAAELHGTTTTAEGVARMRPVEAVEIPAGGRVSLAPGGLHVMLVDLAAPLVEGASFPATLVFERAGEVGVEFAVENPRATTGGHEGHGGAMPMDHGVHGGHGG